MKILDKDVARCLETLSVQACAEMMRDNGIGFVPVVDAAGQVVGVVTDRDLVLRVLANDLPSETPVGQVMTCVVRICRPDDIPKEVRRREAPIQVRS
jgi:CBS domain-containing protein